MFSHRLPIADGDRLTFPPQYALRYAAAWLVLLFWSCLLVVSLTIPEALEIKAMSEFWVNLGVRTFAPIVYAGAVMYLRAKHLALDRQQGQILVAQSFSGFMGAWDVVGNFDPTGTITFEFCQAELQTLAVMSYASPGTQERLILHIYTQPDVARDAATRLRLWESRLSVTEVQDQAALPTLRGDVPLVE
jgi:hypothetical protein